MRWLNADRHPFLACTGFMLLICTILFGGRALLSLADPKPHLHQMWVGGSCEQVLTLGADLVIERHSAGPRAYYSSDPSGCVTFWFESTDTPKHTFCGHFLLVDIDRACP